MEKTHEKLWFRAKRYGWGWYPCTWEGWAVLLVWVVVFVFSMFKLDHEWLKNFVIIFVMALILILICYLKGERPRWRWG